MERTNTHAPTQETGISTLETAALLAGCRPEEILAVRVTPDGGLSVIDPSGRKRIYSPDQVRLTGGCTAHPKPRGASGKAALPGQQKRGKA